MKVHRHTPSGGKQRVGLGWFKPGAWLGALSRGHDLRLFMGGFLAFLVVGYFLAALLLFPAPFFAEASTVPDVIGMSQSDAQRSTARRGAAGGRRRNAQPSDGLIGERRLAGSALGSCGT